MLKLQTPFPINELGTMPSQGKPLLSRIHDHMTKMNSDLSWYVVRTKPRQEERAVENLRSWGVATLAPRLGRDAGRRDSHLFPGYIFARFEGLKMLHNIHFTRGVAYVVSFGGVPAPIGDELIGEIYARMDQNGFVQHTVRLNRGDAVVIQSGILRNFVGVFERELPGAKRVQILLRSVGYIARVEVDRSDVAKMPVAPNQGCHSGVLPPDSAYAIISSAEDAGRQKKIS